MAHIVDIGESEPQLDGETRVRLLCREPECIDGFLWAFDAEWVATQAEEMARKHAADHAIRRFGP